MVLIWAIKIGVAFCVLLLSDCKDDDDDDDDDADDNNNNNKYCLK